jgi:adenylate cyclase
MIARILVVDDEPDVVEFLKKRLEAKEFEVVTASDGVEGLTKAQEAAPDLILLDITMPRRDGFSMLRALRSDNATSRIPVIMITGKGQTSDIFEGQALGVDDYIVKPLDFDQLLKYIHKYLF